MLKTVQYFFKIAVVLTAMIILWHLLLPALFVLSFVPQIATPPINWVTTEPTVSQIQPHLDLYETKSRSRGNHIIFHAANELGKDDPRIQKLAAVFARAGFRVFVPTLANLNREKFHPQVIEEMREVIRYVGEQNPNQPVLIFSFSIGVGPELIVAARPEIKDKLDLIIAFGGYLDLENVVAFHTTSSPAPDPFGTWLLARYYAQFLPQQDAAIFYQLADRKWKDPHANIEDLAKDLGPDGLKALALVENKDPAAVSGLIENLPPELKNFFAAFDPKPQLKNLEAPVLLLHSRRDPVIPFEESEKLLIALKQADKQVELIELKIFDHVNPVLPKLAFKNLFSLYLPEFWRLYQAAWKIIY